MRRNASILFGCLTTILVLLLGCGGRKTAAPQDGAAADPVAKSATDTSTLTTSPTVGIDMDNAFFQSLGTNGRACATCHDSRTGWSITPDLIRQRFSATNGTDPIFRTNDGAVSPDADVSTAADRHEAYRMLLRYGLIRVGLPVPATADFALAAVNDPYQFASQAELSLFRRPLPSTNLRYLSTVMVDGRESPAGRTIQLALFSQANDATTGHAQGVGLTTAQQAQIVAFETSIYSAQLCAQDVVELDADGALGGPDNLSLQQFSTGINDPANAGFNPQVFQLFGAWLSQGGLRASIARGEQIFNARTFTIQGVAGLNDVIGQPQVQGTCSGCHNTPNVGNHSTASFFNIGTAELALQNQDFPAYTFRDSATGQTQKTTDPGRALITGLWADIGKFKVPGLRNLATHPPYFHNGQASDIDAVISFYDSRFNIGLSDHEQQDLEAFLLSL